MADLLASALPDLQSTVATDHLGGAPVGGTVMIRLDLCSEWADHLTCEVGGTRWVSLPGECSGYQYGDDESFASRRYPPSVLVAALGECATCHGFDVSPTDAWWDGDLVDGLAACPDCLDGRPLVEVRMSTGGGFGWGWTSGAGCWVADMPDGLTEPLPIITESAWKAAPGVPDVLTFSPPDVIFDPLLHKITLPDRAERVGEWGVRLRRMR